MKYLASKIERLNKKCSIKITVLYSYVPNIKRRIFRVLKKYKQIHGIVQSYIYIGKGDVLEYIGEKPITVKMQLHNQMPVSLYTEFIKKV